jgi:hypothetical protein
MAAMTVGFAKATPTSRSAPDGRKAPLTFPASRWSVLDADVGLHLPIRAAERTYQPLVQVPFGAPGPRYRVAGEVR